MDQATRRQRARNKAMAGKRGNLPEFEPRGLGRKGKRAETFPAVRCEFVEGGRKVFLKKSTVRKGRTEHYSIPMIVGGTRCECTAVVDRRCLKHVGTDQYGNED